MYFLWNIWIQLRLWNELLKKISLNDVFKVWGMAFIPDNKKPDINGESDTNICSRDETVYIDVN
jgi:hypothetical protein